MIIDLLLRNNYVISSLVLVRGLIGNEARDDFEKQKTEERPELFLQLALHKFNYNANQCGDQRQECGNYEFLSEPVVLIVSRKRAPFCEPQGMEVLQGNTGLNFLTFP